MQLRSFLIAGGAALAAACTAPAMAASNVISGGVTYTHPVEKGIDGLDLDNNASIEKHGDGGDVLAGAMFDLGAGVRLTAQVEQMFLKTKLASNGNALGDAKINPVVGSLLVGYAF